MSQSPCNAKHTPGPWELTKNPSRFEVRISPMESYAFTHADEANARLIATAPELLEALKSCLVDLAEYESPKKGYFVSAEKARVIIAKAEGVSDV